MVLVLLAGCSKLIDNEAGKQLARLPASRRASPVVEPREGPWKRAWVDVRLSSRNQVGRGGARVMWTVRTVLVLEDRAGARLGQVMGERHAEGDDEHLRAANASWEVRLDDAGARVALSSDGGPWRLVANDGAGFVRCVHLDLGAPPADPFARAPSPRALALDVLTRPEAHPASSEASEGSLAEAWVAAHPEDVEANVLAARAAERIDWPPSESAKLAAARIPAVRAVHLATIAGDGRGAGRAARRLELCDDRDVQLALGKRLRETVTAGDISRGDFAIAFARNVEVRRRVEPEIESLLYEGFGDPSIDPYRVWALRALGAGRARAVLESLAADCSQGQARPWPSDIADISSGGGLTPCWARSALK